MRKSGEDKLTEAITDIRQTLSFLKGASWFVMGVFGVAGALLIAWLVKTLGWG